MATACPKVKLSDGKQIPIVGLGTYKSKPGEVYDAVCHAIDAGYRHLDCALFYANEAEIGKAIHDKIKQGVVTREELFVTSKNWNTYRNSTARIAEGLQKTLTDLGLDYLDLYLIHWPFSWQEGDNLVPMDSNGKVIYSDVDYLDVWKAMEQMQKEGKARSIGVSNFNKEQIERVLKEGSVKPAMNQVECHAYLQQEKLRAFCEEKGIALTAYCPLGRPYAPPTGDVPAIIEHPVVKEIAAALGKSTGQILIRYTLQRGIVVIPKSSNKERIQSNFQVFDFQLNEEQMKALRGLDKGIRMVPLDNMKDHKYFPFTAEF